MKLAPVVAAALAVGLGAASASAAPATPWPPAEGPGQLFVHYGEEHWNDRDGLTLLPKVVAESIRYRPLMVTMSGDKDNDGEVAQLTRWKQIMEAYDRAGIPYFAAVGNHDRKSPPGVPGGTSFVQDFTNYREVFASRPYPMGDARPYANPDLSPRTRPASDPAGASSHYYVDYAATRWIFVDNSCWGITNCDALQTPSFPDADGNDGQLEWLERVAGQARTQGKLAFVVMHMPTRDPRDQSYTDTTAMNHVMGKGASPDNDALEAVAERTGVDAVFVAHIKGQFLYRGRAGIPYYIDGGAGGELYTTGPVGADHGYWHGFRLLRVDGGRIAATDTVPIFVPGGIRAVGPSRVPAGTVARFEGFGRQPVFLDTAKVEALELRDPDPTPKSGSSGEAWWTLLRWVGGPALMLLLAGWVLRSPVPRRRVPAAATAATVALGGLGAVALAQKSAPTSTPRASLPNPARMWTVSNPLVLAPVASATDDARRDPATQTEDGAFRGTCPGRVNLTLASGFESRTVPVTVASRPGRLLAPLRRGARVLRGGRAARLVTLDPVQPAEVLVRVRRGRFVRTLLHACLRERRAVRWSGRTRTGRRVRPGVYRVEVTVRSDLGVGTRRLRLRVG